MRARIPLVIPLVIVSASCALAACHPSALDGGAPRRDCALTIWHRPARVDAKVSVVGSWDGYRAPGVSLDAARGDGWRGVRLSVPAGEQTYAIVEDGAWLVDRNVGTTAYVGGREVTWVRVESCEAPAIAVDDVTVARDGTSTIHARFLASSSGDRLDARTLDVTRAGSSVSFVRRTIDEGTGAIELVAQLPIGKHTFTLQARDASGRLAEPARAIAWVEPSGEPWDFRDAVIYQVIVDRYRDGSGGALKSPSPPSARAGGTLDGVRAAIESGELAALGVDALWLSPVYTNPDGFFRGNDGKMYSSYHGYWPIAAREVDPKLGGHVALDALIAAAHARGVRVLFDVVPNHVHEQHPYFVEHRRDGWFDDVDGSCICGVTCDFATHALDCWFAPYLPDLAWTNAAVATQVSDDVTYLVDRFDADGVRIDAVPLMPRSATRRIVDSLRRAFDQGGHRTFVLGENFTGPDGYDSIRYYLGPSGLDSEFDFPTMWALRASIAAGTSPMSSIDDAIHAGFSAWNDTGAIMARILGNHDVTRFSSVSAGDASGDGFVAAAQSSDPLVYRKQQLSLGVLYALPGAPVIYYGDEVALAGRGDPDSRRVMPADDALSSLQKGTRDFTRALGKARRCSRSLRRGGYRTLAADGEHLVFARELEGEASALIVVTRNDDSAFEAPLPSLAAGLWVDVLSNTPLDLDPKLTRFPAGAMTFRLYFPAASACATKP